MQLLDLPPRHVVTPFNQPLLKWIGSKQRFAHEIISHFPSHFGTFYEPFLGSGAVLGTLAPLHAVGSDTFKPLMEIWIALKENPDAFKEWYRERWEAMKAGDKVAEYERVKAAYNLNPNGADFVFLTRSCYGGVVRFRKHDGYMSTPCGPHQPIPPSTFARRVDEWRRRLSGAMFLHCDYEEAMHRARPGDLIYCDPPYTHSQAILYGAQDFSLARLFEVVADCKMRGVHVAVSIDGNKRSGDLVCDIPVPPGLFEQEIFVTTGRSMLKRFQMEGQSLEAEVVVDRLLLTYA